MTQIDVSRDREAGVTDVRLTGDADARWAGRLLDALEVAATMAPGVPVRIDLTGAGQLSPAFAVIIARSVHAARRAGRAVTVLDPGLPLRGGSVETVLRPLAAAG